HCRAQELSQLGRNNLCLVCLNAPSCYITNTTVSSGGGFGVGSRGAKRTSSGIAQGTGIWSRVRKSRRRTGIRPESSMTNGWSWEIVLFIDSLHNSLETVKEPFGSAENRN